MSKILFWPVQTKLSVPNISFIKKEHVPHDHVEEFVSAN
jgi:hypothetical protein